MKLKFQTYDTVIMQSIIFGQGFFRKGTTISEIIECGDAFDKSIIEYKQLKEVLPKFLTSGMIEIKNDRIFLTKKYRQTRKKHKNEIKKIKIETDKIAIIFNELENGKYDDLKKIPKDFLTELKWEVAYKNYMKKY